MEWSNRIAILAVWFLTASGALQIPEDVEIMDDHPFSLYWNKDPSVQENQNHFIDGFIKAIRNRRALTYHIKSSPKPDAIFDIHEPILEGIPNHLIKRDLEKIGDMDVSAQYTEQFDINHVNPRTRREIIEEEDVKNGNQRGQLELSEVQTEEDWLPEGSKRVDEVDIFDEKTDGKKPDSTTGSVAVAEPLVDKLIGRGARGLTKDQWVKLPFVPRPLENDQLSSSIPRQEEASNRMPRVNFVTQGKGLLTAESRNQRESLPRSSYSRSTDLRTDIYPADKDSKARSSDYTSYYRKSYYYPDDYRRTYYDDNGYTDDFYYGRGRDPYYDRYDNYRNGRRYDFNDYGRVRDPYDRYDGYEDYARYDRTNDKPRRIIYYANLPDVVRTPPNVYRYNSNPYNRYDDDRYYRDSRYYDTVRGGYPISRYPYSALKKAENEGPKDLSGSSTSKKEKPDSQKRQEQNRKASEEASRARDRSLNSHQYPLTTNSNNVDESSKSPHQTLYHDITRMDNDFHRYDHPSFQAAVDDPYVSRHD